MAEAEALFAVIPGAVVIFHPDGTPLRANRAALELFGFDPVGLGGEELASRLDLGFLESGPLAFEQFPHSRALRGERVTGELLCWRNKEQDETLGSGEETRPFVILEVSADPVWLDGVLAGAVTVWQDVTEKEQVLSQVEIERARLSAIIANVPGAIVLADKHGRVILTNPVADRLYMHPVSEEGFPQDFPAPKICYPDGLPYHPDNLPLTRSALYGEMHINLEVMLLWPDGQQRFLLINSAPILDRKGQLNGAIGVFQDITRRKQDQAQVQQDSRRIEIQHLLAQFWDMERLSISRQLHDGPLQGLVALLLALKDAQIAASDLPVQPETVRAKLNALHSMIVLDINKLREFCYELRPPTLAPLGLAKAIRSHAEKAQEKHPEIAFHLELARDGQSLSEKVRLALFRIYEELLDNVLWHSGATEVLIQFNLTASHAELLVRDNGRGFEVPSQWVQIARQGHLGLADIQERSKALGGTLWVDSAPEKGTTVEVKVPVSV
jgi:signal transduction histidine kinase